MKVQVTLAFDLEDEDGATIEDDQDYHFAADAAQHAIGHRLIGEGFLSDDSLIGTWAVDARVIDGQMGDPDPIALSEAHGGLWGEHPGFPVGSWVQDVLSSKTRAGYWRWIAGKMT